MNLKGLQGMKATIMEHMSVCRKFKDLSGPIRSPARLKEAKSLIISFLML
jgi:hypothetical protein